ncbi:MAG: hypothetical protein ND866_26030 [Pyrinomonadaceae bacterium]|nr:hypothetical protein [Pyrinomonadaceae bacterium]
MSVSRRKFIKSGTLTALSASLVFKAAESAFGQKSKPDRPISKFEVPYEARQNPIIYYDRVTFEPYVGGTFIGRDARGRTIELRLLRVTEYKPNPSTRITTGGTRDTDSFSLTFNASRSLPPFTSIHAIEHPVLGKFDLFLQRSDDSGQIIYQAVINHLR